MFIKKLLEMYYYSFNSMQYNILILCKTKLKNTFDSCYMTRES